jgi:mannan endo-1,4-beta-mannosidase
MISNSLRLRAVATIGAIAGLLLMAACAAGNSQTSAANAQSHFVLTAKPVKITAAVKAGLLHPKHKYYGISITGIPQDVSPTVRTLKQQTGKRPNLALYFQDWGSGAINGTPNFSTTDAENACAAGMLPMYTWESWDTSVTAAGQGAAYVQPAFNMKRIIAGDYDAYIRATAKQIASIGCPLALRFDQEANGDWYPWGITNHQENGANQALTAKRYIEMWRHVYRIFAAAKATNVLWVWSPNWQSLHAGKLLSYHSFYPGKSYVDWVGIDGYYAKAGMTFYTQFGDTIQQLAAVCPHKPWVLSETAVGSHPGKPGEIKNLLNSVAKNKRFNGLVYFDDHKSTDRSFWPFDDPSYPKSMAAFRAGIDQKTYASGKPGLAWFKS